MNKHHPANNVTPKGDYLKNKNIDRYRTIIKKLELRK